MGETYEANVDRRRISTGRRGLKRAGSSRSMAPARTSHRAQRPELLTCMANRQVEVIIEVSHAGNLLLLVGLGSAGQVRWSARRGRHLRAVHDAFGAIQSLLFEFLPGYQGVDIADRGTDP
jgi:hypothetical protein